MSDTAQHLIDAARRLSAKVDALAFAPPVSHVYNPLDYAWALPAVSCFRNMGTSGPTDSMKS